MKQLLRKFFSTTFLHFTALRPALPLLFAKCTSRIKIALKAMPRIWSVIPSTQWTMRPIRINWRVPLSCGETRTLLTTFIFSVKRFKMCAFILGYSEYYFMLFIKHIKPKIFLRHTKQCKNIYNVCNNNGARVSVVGCGIMLQAGRSRVRFAMRLLDITIDLILSDALRPWGRLSL
jgi:hypothetical protein